jgi:large subunit ribosomal protein L24
MAHPEAQRAEGFLMKVMQKIHKGDLVFILKGKDQGKKGKVLQLSTQRAVVEGLNLVKKCKRRTQQDQQGGIVSIESPINISNLMLVCPHCHRPSRIGFQIGKDGEKSRICKSCKGVI